MTTTIPTPATQTDGAPCTKMQLEFFPSCQMTGKHTYAAWTTKLLDRGGIEQYVLVRECLYPDCDYEELDPSLK